MSSLTQHLFSEPQEQSLLDELASPNFQTDWGTRSTSTASGVFDPDSYAKGSVWAVGTAASATAFWNGHRPATAFAIWSGLVPWSSLDSLGHMDEVLAGDYYHEQTESVPEQTWSSASFFHAAVRGLLGLQVDGVSATGYVCSTYYPRIGMPLTVRNIRLPEAKIDFIWTRTDYGSSLEAINSGDPIQLIYQSGNSSGFHAEGGTVGWEVDSCTHGGACPGCSMRR